MRYRVTVLTGARAGQCHEGQGSSLLVGRGDDCTVQLDPYQDVLVSQQHGRITLEPGPPRYEDTSTNGSFIRGEPVTQCVLSTGSVVELGRGGPQLRLELYPLTTEDHGQPSDPGAAARRQRPTILVQHLSHFAGERQEFPSPVIRIGRDPLSEVAFDAEREVVVSANHCKVTFLEGHLLLLDNDSTNGSFVNGRPVTRCELIGGEEVMLGRGGPRFRVWGIAAGAPGPPPAKATVAGNAALIESTLAETEGELLLELPLNQSEPVTCGRDDSCLVRLPSMHVSARHARLSHQDGRWLLHDAGSSNGTYFQGQRIHHPVPLQPPTEFVIPPYLLHLTGTSLRVFDTQHRVRVDAHQLVRQVGPGRAPVRILDDVSLQVSPGHFVALLGPSGAGKSTLLKALNGAERATGGHVLVNGIDLYRNFEALKHLVGYVPQDDIIHPQLTIRRSLSYAARLRMPVALKPAERAARVEEVMSILELADRAETPIALLSGGQRKRVSIGVELLTEPGLLYLDEPTSGLSPDLEERMMHLLRELALRGRTVVCVTHMLDHVHLCHRVALMMRGRLVFYGTDEEMRAYFGVTRPSDTYKKLEEHPADVWQARFRQSPGYPQPAGLPATATAPEPGPGRLRRRRTSPGPLGQFLILSRRYAELVLRDRRNTGLLLAQAPLIALFTLLALTGERVQEGPTSTLYLILGLAALWCGCSNAARELTKERAIFRRERMVGQNVVAYVGSKFVVLSLLSLVQVTLLLVITDGFALRHGANVEAHYILGGVPGPWWHSLANLQLTATTGVAMGLLISALAGNSDKAMSLVPMALIPQVLFSGAFGLSHAWTVKRIVGYLMPLNWSLDLFKRSAGCSQEQIDQLVRGQHPTCMYAFHPGQTQPLLRVQEGMAQPDPHEVMLAVSDGLYSVSTNLTVLVGLCLALFAAVTWAVHHRR